MSKRPRHLGSAICLAVMVNITVLMPLVHPAFHRHCHPHEGHAAPAGECRLTGDAGDCDGHECPICRFLATYSATDGFGGPPQVNLVELPRVLALPTFFVAPPACDHPFPRAPPRAS